MKKQNLIEKIKINFQRKSIQKTISIYFTLISIGGMFLITILFYFNFVNMAKDMIEQKNIQVTEQTNQYLDSTLRNIMKISDTMYNEVIKNIDFEKISVKEQMELLYDSNKEQLVSIALFDQFGKIVEAVPLSTLKENINPRDNDWFKNANNEIKAVHFSTPHVQNLFYLSEYRYRWVVSLSRSVQIKKSGKVQDGILLVDMNFSGIEQVCRSGDMGSRGYMYLIDQNGEIIYHPRQQLLYSGLEAESNEAVLKHKDGSYTEEFNGEKRMITIQTVGYTGWKLVAVAPIADVMKQFNQITEFVVIILLFGLFIMILASFLVSYRIAEPIKKLEKIVRQFEKGNWDTDFSIGGSYEIQHLAKVIRSMVYQMRKLMDDIVNEQELKRKSELDALQTQINPHFLYNTLDSIVWMIENERYDGAVTMVTALARFFRISISKGKSIISIKEELEHAKNYLTIQKIRYKNKFTYLVEAEKEVLCFATVKLVLQPIIENAISHGMEYMTEEDGGKIYVKAYQKDDKIYLDVIDNGIGMTSDIVDRLLVEEKKVKGKGSGIGMRNVHERIQLYFGSKYGLIVESEPDEGTIIHIHIPKVPIEEIQKNEQEKVKW